INQCKITKNLSQNVVHSDSDLILHNSSVLIDKEPKNLKTKLKKFSFKVNLNYIMRGNVPRHLDKLLPMSYQGSIR
ncbi:hypothetical protein DMB20_12070, partial [Enterococcus faecium]